MLTALIIMSVLTGFFFGVIALAAVFAFIVIRDDQMSARKKIHPSTREVQPSYVDYTSN